MVALNAAHDSARVGAGCAYIWVPCACGRIHTRACACQFHKQYHKQHCSPGVSSELRGTHMLTRTLLSPLVAHAITETKEASPHQPTRCTCSRQVPCTAEAGMPAGACVLQGWVRPPSSGAPARTRTPCESQTPAAAAAPAARSACVQVVEQSTCAQLRPSPWSASAPRQPSRSGHGWTGRSGCCRTPQQSQQSGSGR